MQLLNCWEINKCERQRGGNKINDLGECLASRKGMGHSCWAVAGTMCAAEIQCTYAKKIRFCKLCEVYAVEDRIPRVYPWMNEPLQTIARVYDVFTFGQLQLEL